MKKTNLPKGRACAPAFSSFALVALCLGLCACSGKAQAPALQAAPIPQVLFSDEVYDCTIQYVSSGAAFRLDLAFQTMRDEETLELRIVDVPKLSEGWPVDLPEHGLQSLFEGSMEGTYRFPRNDRASSDPFARSRPWRFSGFAIGEEHENLDAALTSAYIAARQGVEAVPEAVLLAIGFGASCAELESAIITKDSDGVLWANANGYTYIIEAQTLLDSEGKVDSRSFLIQGKYQPDSDDSAWKPKICVEITRRGSARPSKIAYEAPERSTLQKPTTQGWYMPRIDGSTATIPLTRSLYRNLYEIPEEDAAALVRHNKTHQAFVNVVEGYADIAFVTEPSPEELAYAESRGVALSIAPIAREAFVFIVNANNPVSDISLEDIRRIYRGELSWWSQLGLNSTWDSPIAAFIRPPNSGSQTLFEKLVLSSDQIVMRQYEEEGMGDLILSVAGVREHQAADEETELAREVAWPDGDSGFTGGLGYTVYFYLSEMMANPDVKLIAVDGVYPDEESIVSLQYPLLSAYYAVTRSGADMPYSARALLEWIGTRQGEEALRAGKYIPWTARPTRG